MYVRSSISPACSSEFHVLRAFLLKSGRRHWLRRRPKAGSSLVWLVGRRVRPWAICGRMQCEKSLSLDHFVGAAQQCNRKGKTK
jgi:hypothetical protein